MLRVKRGSAHEVQLGTRLNMVPLGLGLPTIEEIEEEIDQMIDVLLGRVDSPVNSPYLAMQEVATAYFARAQELDLRIHEGERKGEILRNSPYYKLRTGELRAFIELAKRCAELGSRRLSQEQLLAQQRMDYGA